VPELARHLAAAGVRTVVVTGVVTDLCVIATAASAFERGLYVVVPRECTAGTDAEAAAHALRSLERWYGEVVPLEEIVARWSAALSPATRCGGYPAPNSGGGEPKAPSAGRSAHPSSPKTGGGEPAALSLGPSPNPGGGARTAAGPGGERRSGSGGGEYGAVGEQGGSGR